MALLQYFRPATKKELPNPEGLQLHICAWNLPRYMPNHHFVFDYCHSIAIHSVASLSPTLQLFSNSCLPYCFVDVEASNTSLHLKSCHRQMYMWGLGPCVKYKGHPLPLLKGSFLAALSIVGKLNPRIITAIQLWQSPRKLSSVNNYSRQICTQIKD